MSEAPRLEMRGVEKRFGALVALSGVDLVVEAGEVHALIGQNGAGKSTLMKVLAGAVAADAGALRIDGAPYAPRGPADAIAAGVAMVYQELNLAPDLTVAQNLVLGRESSRLGWLRAAPDRARVERVLAVLARPELAPDRRVAELDPGARQLVEIGRALAFDARLVVLDEPTSSLSAAETSTLYGVIERLRADGVSIVYISHFLEEVKRVADRYTVLRDGATVAVGAVRDASVGSLVEAMVGRRLDEAYPPRPPSARGAPLLALDGLAGEPLPSQVSLTLHRGEVLGLAGLVGAGRTELLRAVFGLAPVRAGTVRVAGVEDRGRPTPARVRQGLGMVSEDRKEEGLALARSVAENLTLSSARPFSRGGWVRPAARDACAQRYIDALSIKTRGPAQPAGELSGGNQQKIAIARLLHQDADVLLLDEPTRGVDVGSKVEIYRLIGELAAKGKAVLVVSSYLPELLGVCDRIAVMHRGRLGPARPAAEWTEGALLDEATRGAA
ncbi:MAG: sugar ABC transporter ATP-binding protein [Sandaracinaceae bacterium]|nr:sugar ABC transporter ATP-binding protein [Sandaracinaceae bacterium]